MVGLELLAVEENRSTPFLKITGDLASLPPRPQSGREIPVEYSIT